jgi:broad specificity phosphatase PhoE
MTAELILVRHAEIADRYAGLCYGRSDVELSGSGRRRSREVSLLLAHRPISLVLHSGLRRTRYLAERIAARVGCAARSQEALQERYFGDWELESWDALHERRPGDMLRMVSEPDTYRPGGGETTFEMRDRMLKWFNALPRCGLTVAVAHGGPIAALRGACQGLPVSDWLPLIPACGEWVSMELTESLRG